MALITYEEKENTRESTLPRKNTVTAEDLNEIKAVVNANAGAGPGPVETPTFQEVLDASLPSAPEVTAVIKYNNQDPNYYLTTNGSNITGHHLTGSFPPVEDKWSISEEGDAHFKYIYDQYGNVSLTITIFSAKIDNLSARTDTLTTELDDLSDSVDVISGRFENVTNFSDISASIQKRLILVDNDETNNMDRTLYLFDGAGLQWIPTQPI